ncbi:MAG: glycosyltransferase [Oceanicaulis sp.]|nr:glycosyltransferase [Oceanicaulis sp.]
MTDKPLYFTICSRNYLAYAITLGRSLQAADSQARFVIFLADEAPSPADQARIGFETITASQIAIPAFEDMVLRYSIMEFNTAIKPFCFRHVFSVMGVKSAVYLDPDILVLRPLEAVEAALAGGAGLVLTPHSEAPLDDGADPDDARLLRTGTYNLGFAAFADTDETRRFLAWWGERLRVDCRVAIGEGLFVDQKWMDLAPAYVRQTHILHHPGYNAAYWNLAHRPVTGSDDDWRAAGEPLVFFHFSGGVPGNVQIFSKHQDRFGVADIGPLKTLLGRYLAALDGNGHSYWRGVPYGYGRDRDGRLISDVARAVYRRVLPEPQAAPMAAGAARDSLCHAPAPEVDQNPGPVTRFAYEVWAGRPDLHSHFDLAAASGRVDFNGWLLRSGVEEMRIEPRYLAHLGVTATDDSAAQGTRLPAPLRLLLKYRVLLRPVAALVPTGLLTRLKRLINRQLDRAAPSELAAFDLKKPESEAGMLVLEGQGRTAVYGYFTTENGVGEAGRRTFRALRSVGWPVAARVLTTRGHFSEAIRFEVPFDTSATPLDAHLFHMNADELVQADLRLDQAAFSPDCLRIGYWAWELDRFPQAWQSAFDKVDEIWVPSAFTQASVQAATGKPVHVVAHPVPVPDPASAEDRARARARFALPPEQVLFLTAFDFNSWIERKNPHAVLDAYAKARVAAGNLGLVIKCHGHSRFDVVRHELMERIRALPDVFVIDRVLSTGEMEDLYAACDGLISLHRSEGFGLTIAEAMARGLPAVATGYSGNTDFLDDTTGIAVPYTLVDVPEGAYPQGEGCQWADPDIAAAAQALERLAGDEALRSQLGAAARARVATTLSYEVTGRKMSALIEAGLARRAHGEAA